MKRKTIKKRDTRPLFIKFIECIYSGPVNVKNAPSGKKYSFMPGQVKPIHNQMDFDYLKDVRRDSGPGCCSGSPYAPRFYFAVHKEV